MMRHHQAEILYASDVAQLMGKSQQAVTNLIKRESDALPPGRFKVGRLWAWKRSRVMDWLENLDAEEATAPQEPRRRPGRPRATPASPQALRG
ncbi:hypothetical protein AAGT95_03090 [Salinicola lusitanus]|uniref:Helix-turn-helix domain-containing protein n=1 Tax=Salinicola lusitanus TaxID=1949085 RepID=A0ABZ3CV41_9GAMM